MNHHSLLYDSMCEQSVTVSQVVYMLLFTLYMLLFTRYTGKWFVVNDAAVGRYQAVRGEPFDVGGD